MYFFSHNFRFQKSKKNESMRKPSFHFVLIFLSKSNTKTITVLRILDSMEFALYFRFDDFWCCHSQVIYVVLKCVANKIDSYTYPKSFVKTPQTALFTILLFFQYSKLLYYFVILFCYFPYEFVFKQQKGNNETKINSNCSHCGQKALSQYLNL